MLGLNRRCPVAEAVEGTAIVELVETPGESVGSVVDWEALLMEFARRKRYAWLFQVVIHDFIVVDILVLLIHFNAFIALGSV
jgi:hypothetical protein